jgi:hypothetical protein
VGPEFQVNSYTTYFQGRPEVASDASGNFVVVWVGDQQDGSYFGIFGQRYDASGTAQGAEFQVNSYTTGLQAFPAVASDASGNFVVVWSSRTLFGGGGQDGSDSGVFGQRFDSLGNRVGGEFQVNSYTTYSQFLPAVASDANGNFVVVWSSSEQDGSYAGVFGQRYDASGTAQGSEFQVNAYTTSFQSGPAVASDANGNFVVIWSSYGQDGSYTGIFGQRYDASGTPQGAEFQVNSSTTSDQYAPSIASDVNGDFVVVWSNYAQDASFDGIFGQRYDASGTPQGAEFQVNSYTPGYQLLPSVASDASGSFVVVWISFPGQDGSAAGVFGQRYDASGTAQGAEFQVNSYTAYSQSVPSVASSADGDFVVVWSSQQDGYLSADIFGQRFASAVTAVIDIKPGSFPNRVQPTSPGVIPVAILTTPTFDATTVDALSVEFGPKGAIEAHGRGHTEDVDGDGDDDLLLHFRTQATGIQCGDSSASLIGQTGGGQAVQGTDSIVTVGCDGRD